MSTRTRLNEAIHQAAVAAEQLAIARREVISALRLANKEHQQAVGRLEEPPLLKLERFDRELAHLLAAGGFVSPFHRTRPSSANFADASVPKWAPRRDADSAAALVARWQHRLGRADVAIARG